VEYQRPPHTWNVLATFGRTSYEVADGTSGGGVTVGSHVWDFLVLAGDLGDEPQPGDVIVADERRFEVLPLGEDVQGWRWSDPYHQTYRIHTREIGPAA
jgi:hypothetical protein